MSTIIDDRSDTLAWPVSFDARYGAGKNRAVVFGGGGVYLLAWYVSYLSGLKKAGIDLGNADLAVGTSAGGQAAAWLAADAIQADATASAWLPRLAVMGEITGATRFPSQLRALDLLSAAETNDPKVFGPLGRAALAAHAPEASETRRVMRAVLEMDTFPPAVHMNATDAFTGERLVITATSGVDIARAATASASVPGLFRPQPVLDRFCIDGCCSGSNAHCDIAAGAARALVLALEANEEPDPNRKGSMTVPPGYIHPEIAQLAAAGTTTLLRGPSSFTPSELMSSSAVSKAWDMAQDQAKSDAGQVRNFWA